jgi:Undecaprenyl-phosphate glucose phosphotransferase
MTVAQANAMRNRHPGADNAAASPSAQQALRREDRPSAHIVTYGQPGKVAVSDFTRRRTGLSAVFNARTLPILAIGIEFALVVAASFEAGALYHRYAIGTLPHAEFYLTATTLLAAVFVVPCGLNRDYSVRRLVQIREQLRSVFLHWNSAYLLFAVALFLSHATDFYSRGSVVAQYFAGLSAAVALRLVMAYAVGLSVRSGRFGGRRALILGDAASVAYVTRRLNDRGCGIDIVGTVKLPSTEWSADGRTSDLGADLREALEAVQGIARRVEIDEIIISLPWSEGRRIRRFVDELAIIPAAIHLAPDASAAWAHHLTPARVGSLPTLNLSRTPLTWRDRIVKRCFDVIVGTMLLAVALPLFLIVGLLIKLDSRGPVFFRQRRHGFNQGEFRIFKFRTMTTLDDGEKIRQATRDDKRITRVGRFLRRTNLDELPQLFNVLAGQMSLVGPRPHALAHNNEFEEKIRLYAKRHNVKPGITGWSQVNGFRGETDTLEKMQKRVDYDAFYIDNWSLKFDIIIMFSTIFSINSYKNAY